MCNTLYGINNGASKVIGRVDLPLVSVTQIECRVRESGYMETYPVR